MSTSGLLAYRSFFSFVVFLNGGGRSAFSFLKAHNGVRHHTKLLSLKWWGCDGRGLFHIPPCHVEPAAKETAAEPSRLAWRRFPRPRNARPLQGGPGIFACGCQGGITHYTLPPRGGCKACAGDTRDPILRLRLRWKRALTGPQACAPLPPFLPPFTGG